MHITNKSYLGKPFADVSYTFKVEIFFFFKNWKFYKSTFAFWDDILVDILILTKTRMWPVFRAIMDIMDNNIIRLLILCYVIRIETSVTSNTLFTQIKRGQVINRFEIYAIIRTIWQINVVSVNANFSNSC